MTPKDDDRLTILEAAALGGLAVLALALLGSLRSWELGVELLAGGAGALAIGLGWAWWRER